MATRRRHSMPFGAEILPDGRVRFRLWAPDQPEVRLRLHSAEATSDRERTAPETLVMTAVGEGWHERITDRARPGNDYAFELTAGPGAGMQVPDPASRRQRQDVHGPSRIVDPQERVWHDTHWRGRPWHEAVIYELHTGCFTPRGSFAAARERLAYLADLGVTALELMPVADFPGQRNWGYDGVLPFAPDSRYGAPEELKALVEDAHGHGLMVFLDVVYNHFGPEGNYLHLYATSFFNEGRKTPWGAAINFDGPDSRPVREFFIHNALYWLEEFHLDGLRFDAVHAIHDESAPHILIELAQRVHQTIGRERHIHLVLENDDNGAHLLRPKPGSPHPAPYVAQWNDDIHHALHVLLTGESDGYYADYCEDPGTELGRCLTEGFAYQGRYSHHRDRRRGEPTEGLPPTAFVSFLQNHDQIGNRALGERIGMLTSEDALRAATVLLLLAPSPPLLFMGQEWCCNQPFLFFCDFEADLSAKVVEGRRGEFARFSEFSGSAASTRIPDPSAVETFERSRLDWEHARNAASAQWHALHRELLALRRDWLIPRMAGLEHGGAHQATWWRLSERALRACWRLGDDSRLTMLANLGETTLDGIDAPPGDGLYATHDAGSGTGPDGVGLRLPPWSVLAFLEADSVSR